MLVFIFIIYYLLFIIHYSLFIVHCFFFFAAFLATFFAAVFFTGAFFFAGVFSFTAAFGASGSFFLAPNLPRFSGAFSASVRHSSSVRSFGSFPLGILTFFF